MVFLRGVQKLVRQLIKFDGKAVLQNAKGQLSKGESSSKDSWLNLELPRKALFQSAASYYVRTATLASSLRKTATLRIISGRSACFSYVLAFAPLVFVGTQEDKEEIQLEKSANALSFIEKGLHGFKAKDESNIRPTKFEHLTISERLGNPSCCGAVYAATYGHQELAVKVMFNFMYASNDAAVSKGFEAEAALLCPPSNVPEPCVVRDLKSLPRHPNIVKVHSYFVDKMPELFDAKASYPAALPCHSKGYAHNRTLFLVMTKYSQTLQDFAASTKPTKVRESLLLLGQLLEGIAFLRQNYVSHGDLKSSNVLLLDQGNGCPKLVLTDFGNSTYDSHFGLKIPYLTDHVSKGGNTALMAPEIKNAKSGPGCYLDFDKADVWGAGALVYEIFHEENPLYKDNEEADIGCLKPLLGGRLPLVDKLIRQMLQPDPNQRISASLAATYVNLLLFWPEICQLDEILPSLSITRLLRSARYEASLNLLSSNSKVEDLPVEQELWITFLKRTTVDEIMQALNVMKS